MGHRRESVSPRVKSHVTNSVEVDAGPSFAVVVLPDDEGDVVTVVH
jgi:hypothetical protein